MIKMNKLKYLIVNNLNIHTNNMNNDKMKKGKKKNRCNHPECRKKLKLTDMPCRCHKCFCIKHRLPEQHQCGFDFKSEKDEDFIKRVGLGGGEYAKLEII